MAATPSSRFQAPRRTSRAGRLNLAPANAEAGFETPVVPASLQFGVASISMAGVLAFLVGHVVLGAAMENSRAFATLHSLVTLGLGLWWALFGRRLDLVAYAAAYITGAEVWWRMTDASVIYEFGKYSVIVLCVVTMARWRQLAPQDAARSRVLLWYFVLLVPSMLPTFMELGLENGRRFWSFNISGPLALCICGRFFTGLRLTPKRVTLLLGALTAPVIGMATVATINIVTAQNLEFVGESNSVASGGFGPNQVSSLLGLGALSMVCLIVDDYTTWRLRLIAGGVMVWLAVQSALTFSRGGLYNATIGVLCLLAVLAFDSRSHVRRDWKSLRAGEGAQTRSAIARGRNGAARGRLALLLVPLLLAMAGFVALPQLDEFTGGAFSRRFSDIDPTGRTDLAKTDLKLWADNPIFGTGVGLGDRSFANARNVAAHTEFTRLLSEHGLFGLLAAVVLVCAAIANIRRARSARSRALVAALVFWSFAYMLNAAMRTVAPAFLLGLSFATFIDEEPPEA